MLSDILKKNDVFVWTSEHQKSFHILKEALCTTLVLAIPNFVKPFGIETDACDNGVCVVLLQEGHPLAFVSKALGSCTKGLPTCEKEYWRY